MKKILFLGLAGILAIAVTSCKSDEIANLGPKPLEEDLSYFVNINVLGVDALTRAEPDFFTGDSKENEVNSIYLVFYDAEGNRVSTTQVLKDNADDHGPYPGSTTDDSIVSEGRNSFYRGIVQIDVKHGSLPPAYVMAFINPITSQNFDINPDFESLNAVSRTTRPMIMGRDGNFAMSKSVYYGKDRVKGEGYDHEKIVATPLIDEEMAKDGNYAQQLFKSKKAAEDAMDETKDDDTLPGYESEKSSVVNIYVERYAARVNFKLAEKLTSSDPKIELNKDRAGLQQVTLIFKPEYWAVNAYESNTYIVKSFLNAESVGNDDNDFFDPSNTLSWTQLNKALGSDDENKMPWTWNSETYHRSYWAQSPAYYAQKYPRTADDIEDNGPENYPLGYYSYDKMKENANGYLNAKARNLNNSDDKGKPIYARENTVAGGALIAAYNSPVDSPKAAIPSVVLVGHYEIEGEGSLSEDRFIYIRGNATNGYFVYNKEDMLRYFVNTTIPFAVDGNGDSPIFEYNKQYEPDSNGQIGDFTGDKYKEYFEIIHPKQLGIDKEDKLVIDSRFVTIQLKKEVFEAEGAEDIELYASMDGVYTKVTKANIDEVNKQMFYAAGTVQGFSGGKVYYTIPIQHLGYRRSGNDNYTNNLTANSKEFNWEIVKSGDFGLVRNHVYTILVEDIVGLGNGIPDPSVPIVPPTDPEEYYIGARLIVLNWAVVPAQHETL